MSDYEEAEVAAPSPLDLGRTLNGYRLSGLDPTARAEPGRSLLATRTPAGAATLWAIHHGDEGKVTVRGWGAGAGWLIGQVDRMLGAADDPDSFPTSALGAARCQDEMTPRRARSPALGELHRRLRGMRIGVAPSLFEAMVRVVLRQRVSYQAASRSWAALVRQHGEPAPGPADLWLAPSPDKLMELPGYCYRRCQVDGRRSTTIRRLAELAQRNRLEPLRDLPLAATRQPLAAIPGIGPWTLGMTAGLALGDADAVVRGDLHLPHAVAHALVGDPGADDDRMIELLEPYRGHRFRVLRYLWAAGRRAPRGAGRFPHSAR